MTKTARNGIVAAAVVAVVAVAAAPFVLKGIRRQPAQPAEASVSATERAEAITYPVSEDTTVDIIDEILQNMDSQEQTQAAAPQNTTAAPTQSYTPPVQTTAAAPTQSYTPAPTAKPAPTTQAPKPTTTQAPKPTTTKAAPTTTAASGNSPMTTVSGQEALASGGVVSYLWDPNGQFYYVDDNPWQRNFGFNAIYDWAAATMVMYYDTWRACFDYDDLEWMIQGWKGQYGFLFIGCEIGVYTRKPDEVLLTSSHYNCADDNHLINMEMTLYFDAHDGNGYQKLFTRAYYPHWWSTGFVDGHLADYKFNDRSCLIMEARLHMYDDEMTQAFTTALEGCGFRRVGSTSEISTANPDTYTVVGNDVYFAWKNIDQGYKTR